MYPFVHRFSTESTVRRDMGATLNNYCNILKLQANDLFCGFNPFSPSLAKLQAFCYCWKYREELKKTKYSKAEPPPRPRWATVKTDAVFLHNKLAPLIETLLESAPQVIIQLHAIGVQEEPVKIIQMISLPLSILNLSWTFATLDRMLHDDEIGVLDWQHQFLLFVTQLFIVSSRLFAIAFFMVSFKWWIICVLVFHSITVSLVDTVWLYQSGKLTTKAAIVRSDTSTIEAAMDQNDRLTITEAAIAAPCFSFLNWLRDDLSLCLYFDTEAQDENTRKHLIRMQSLCILLFVVENLFMILAFYFEQHSINLYSLSVVVGVGLLSYFGAIIRISHFEVLRRDYTPYTDMVSSAAKSTDEENKRLIWVSSVWQGKGPGLGVTKIVKKLAVNTQDFSSSVTFTKYQGSQKDSSVSKCEVLYRILSRVW